MTPRPFQFTLRRMSIWQTASSPIYWLPGLLGFFGPFAVTALLGAAIGELAGDAKAGARNGAVAGVVLFVLWMWVSGILLGHH